MRGIRLPHARHRSRMRGLRSRMRGIKGALRALPELPWLALAGSWPKGCAGFPLAALAGPRMASPQQCEVLKK